MSNYFVQYFCAKRWVLHIVSPQKNGKRRGLSAYFSFLEKSCCAKCWISNSYKVVTRVTNCLFEYLFFFVGVCPRFFPISTPFFRFSQFFYQNNEYIFYLFFQKFCVTFVFSFLFSQNSSVFTVGPMALHGKSCYTAI